MSSLFLSIQNWPGGGGGSCGNEMYQGCCHPSYGATPHMPHPAMMQQPPHDVMRPPQMYSNAPQGMMGPGVMMRAPYMPQVGMCRMPMGPRMAMRPVWTQPPAGEDPLLMGGGNKRKRGTGGGGGGGGGGGRGKKKMKAVEESATASPVPPPSETGTPPSFLEDPNAYLAQQTAMLNNTMAGGLGQFSPQGTAVSPQRPPSSSATSRSPSTATITTSATSATQSTSHNMYQSQLPACTSPANTAVVPLPSTVPIPARVSKATSSSSSTVAMSQTTLQGKSSSMVSPAPEIASSVFTSSVNTSSKTASSDANNSSQFLCTGASSTQPDNQDINQQLFTQHQSKASIANNSVSVQSQIVQNFQSTEVSHNPISEQINRTHKNQHEPPLLEPSYYNRHHSAISTASHSCPLETTASAACQPSIIQNLGYNPQQSRLSATSQNVAYVSDKQTVLPLASCNVSTTIGNTSAPLLTDAHNSSITSTQKLTTTLATSPNCQSPLSSTFGAAPTFVSSPKPALQNVSSADDQSSPTTATSFSRSLVSPHNRGTEMLAIRSKVLRASPTSNFDLEKEDGFENDDGDDDTVSNDNSEIEDNCSSHSFEMRVNRKPTPANTNKPRQRMSNIKIGRGSPSRKSVDSAASSKTISAAAIAHRSQTNSNNDACNKPLSPGPISSSCTQTPLEMVQNIVSSIPLPPVSPTTVSSIPTSRNTQTFLAQPQQAMAQQVSALQPALYDGLVRGGILVQQQAVASTSSNVVVMASKPNVTSLGTLPSVQPVVHLMNPFSSTTPVIIQQAGGLSNISAIGNISGICSTAQLIPTSGATFVAATAQNMQHQQRVISSHGVVVSSHQSAACSLPNTSSPQLQVAQVVTSDLVMEGAVSPTGSSSSSSTPSIVSTPHTTPPEMIPSPQPAARKRKRRRNASGNNNNQQQSSSTSPVQQANIIPATAIIMNGRQQQVLMANPHQQHYATSVTNGGHLTTQVVTNSIASGSIMAPPPATAINVVQMVGTNMTGGLTAAPLQVQPPAILVGSAGAPPGVLLPSDATFLSTDPNTGLAAGLTYPLQIVGVAAPPTQHMITVRPPHTSAGKVVNCLASPTVGNDQTAGIHLYSHNRQLCPPTAVITPDYLTYQQHVFMQQQQQQQQQQQHQLQQQDKARNAFIAAQPATLIAAGAATAAASSTAITSTTSSAMLDSNNHSVSISTQTLQCEGENCDVSSTGDMQQCRVPAAHSLSPNSPSHQSAEVTTTRLDEEPSSTPHKATPGNPSPGSGNSSPGVGKYYFHHYCIIDTLSTLRL